MPLHHRHRHSHHHPGHQAFPRRAAALAVVLGASLSTALPAWAAGQVEVRYTQPDDFADAGRSGSDRDRTMAALTAHLQRLAQRLPEGQTLRLEITDIDLAGEIRPWGWHELRVLNGRADWPRLALRYTLQEGQRTLQAGDVQLSDLAYMQGLGPRERPNQELPYEGRMVRRWFEETFVKR